jgi:Domain of unknown function (DUF397)
MTTWRKSTYSGAGEERACVELARLTGTVAVRDSKHPEDGHLSLDGHSFGRLVDRIKSGELDR